MSISLNQHHSTSTLSKMSSLSGLISTDPTDTKHPNQSTESNQHQTQASHNPANDIDKTAGAFSPSTSPSRAVDPPTTHGDLTGTRLACSTTGASEPPDHPDPTRALPLPSLEQQSSAPSLKLTETAIAEGYDFAAEPVQPAQSVERTLQSPGLEQYHHGITPAEREKRNSIVFEATEAHQLLAPIRSLDAQIQAESRGGKIFTQKGHYNSGTDLEENTANMGDTEMKGSVDGSQTTVEQALPPSIKTESSATGPEGSKAEPESAISEHGSPAEPASDLPLPATSNSKIPDLPREATPTSRTIANLKREDSSRAPSVDTATPNAQMAAQKKETAGKKRAAPGASKAASKKGIAKKPATPASKKRKLNGDSKEDTPASRRSGTPNSRASKTPAVKGRKHSQSIAGSSPLRDIKANDGEEEFEEEEEDGGQEETSDDNAQYCICRKPDNHTWMIACDGGCEDWFHGKCVDMKEEDGNLIDQYICPNCKQAGKGNTSWKPMCRLEGCRQPARLNKKKGPSKYCSDDHARAFMRQAAGLRAPVKRAAKSNPSQDDASEDEEPTRGGTLKPSELKALVSQSPNLAAFRNLGQGILNPSDPNSTNNIDHTSMNYTPTEQTRLSEINAQKAAQHSRKELIDARIKFLHLVRQRGKAVLEELKRKEKSLKDICGYDGRLAWSDEEFADWRSSPAGSKALEEGVLPPPESEATSSGPNGSAESSKDVKPDGDNENENTAEEEEIGRGVCQKKRCERHKKWIDVAREGNLFELSEVRAELARQEEAERAVREGAVLRGLVEGENGGETMDKTQSDMKGVAVNGAGAVGA